MNHWWRAYDNAVDHAKLLLLSDRQHRAWFNLMCCASANGGTLPELKVLALKLRMPPGKVTALLAELKTAILFDETEGGCAPHNWNDRQFKSDVSTERVKRFRNAKRNVSSTVSETHQRQSTESETEKKEDTASAVSSDAYFFESGVIRLSKKDFEKWRDAFTTLDLKAELLSLTEWASSQPKWFFAVSSALAKRNRDVSIRRSAAQKGKPMTAAGTPWPDGIN